MWRGSKGIEVGQPFVLKGATVQIPKRQPNYLRRGTLTTPRSLPYGGHCKKLLEDFLNTQSDWRTALSTNGRERKTKLGDEKLKLRQKTRKFVDYAHIFQQPAALKKEKKIFFATRDGAGKKRGAPIPNQASRRHDPLRQYRRLVDDVAKSSQAFGQPTTSRNCKVLALDDNARKRCKDMQYNKAIRDAPKTTTEVEVKAVEMFFPNANQKQQRPKCYSPSYN